MVSVQNMGCIADYPGCDVTRRTFSQSHFFEPLKESVSALKMQLKEKLESVFKQEMVKISEADTDPELPIRRAECTETLPAPMSDGQALIAEPVTREDFLQLSDGQALTAESVTRDDFLQYSWHFTLDPNTAHRVLHLSEGNKRVEYRRKVQSYPDHPDRFDRHPQVLCREGVSAHCYWEVEWSGGVGIAVSYKNIRRKGDGDECMFGGNDQSWRLYLSSSSASFHHNNKQMELPLVASSRIGVYVDHRAGALAFYSITGDIMTLLHRVHSTFTHTLYPGFRLFSKPSSVTLF
ncbi:stonustoxin subunit beta-like [Engraulis encrasicolus]|uniref:stonustoxin subunit beta-like n=1 Tax=Engraulis encrasicolus TaxID=184585 RepID=UPI002FD54F1D